MTYTEGEAVIPLKDAFYDVVDRVSPTLYRMGKPPRDGSMAYLAFPGFDTAADAMIGALVCGELIAVARTPEGSMARLARRAWGRVEDDSETLNASRFASVTLTNGTVRDLPPSYISSFESTTPLFIPERGFDQWLHQLPNNRMSRETLPPSSLTMEQCVSWIATGSTDFPHTEDNMDWLYSVQRARGPLSAFVSSDEAEVSGIVPVGLERVPVAELPSGWFPTLTDVRVVLADGARETLYKDVWIEPTALAEFFHEPANWLSQAQDSQAAAVVPSSTSGASARKTGPTDASTRTTPQPSHALTIIEGPKKTPCSRALIAMYKPEHLPTSVGASLVSEVNIWLQTYDPAFKSSGDRISETTVREVLSELRNQIIR